MANDQKMTVDDYLRLPWTIRVGRNEEDGYLVARIAEMPDVLATGADEKALERELWDSLRASIECRLHFGDPVPQPAPDARAVSAPDRRPRKVLQGVVGEAWQGAAVTWNSGSVNEGALA
jgi:hypothetical protein